MLLSVGAVQMLARLGDPETNLERIALHVRALAGQGARLIVLPEAMNAGYLFDSSEQALEYGTALDGSFVLGLGELAAETGTWIGCGISERAGDRLYNSAILVGPEGLAACHRKVNLAPHDRRWFSPGDGSPALADTPFGRVGLFICFDSRLPWISRGLALGGADVLVNCANFFSADKAALHLPARAAENGVPLVAASKAGRERAAVYRGGTCAIDAEGRVLALLGEDTSEGAIRVDLSLRPGVRDARLAARRPAAYGAIEVPFEESAAAQRAREPVIVEDTAVQVAALQGRYDTLGSLQRELEEVTALGSQLWVLPRHPVGNRPLGEDAARAAAESFPELVATVQRSTGAAGAWCVFGAACELDGQLADAHVVVGPEGLVAAQPAVHLPAGSEWSVAGNGWLTVDLPWGRIGVMGDADAAQPESGRCLAALGAELLCVSAACDLEWVRDLAVLERSAETRAHVTFANRHVGCRAPGRSAVVPLTGFPTPKPQAVGRAAPAAPDLVTGFLELASARSKQITSGTRLFGGARSARELV